MKSLLSALIITLFAGSLLTVNAMDNHSNEHEGELFVVITSENPETQMMALVLATQSFNQDVPVRILLCSEAGDLALQDSESAAFAPADRSPKQLLQNLLNNGVTVEVCGIYLPNRDHLSADDLIEGIGTAAPPEVAAYMKQPHVRYFSF